MPVRNAQAQWQGSLRDGQGTFEVQSGAISGSYSFPTRFENAPGTNPEELIGAAHASCYSMALAGALGRAGHNPEHVHTRANVHLDKGDAGFKITKIELHTEAKVPGMSDDDFQKEAQAAKTGCPVSQALAAIDIELTAKLVS